MSDQANEAAQEQEKPAAQEQATEAQEQATEAAVAEQKPELPEKLYDFGGTSFYDDRTTFRFGTGNMESRKKVLERHGHKDVSFQMLPQPMTLESGVKWLQAQGIVAELPAGHRKKEDAKRLAKQAAKQAEATEKAATEMLKEVGEATPTEAATEAPAPKAKKAKREVTPEGRAAFKKRMADAREAKAKAAETEAA